MTKGQEGKKGRYRKGFFISSPFAITPPKRKRKRRKEEEERISFLAARSSTKDKNEDRKQDPPSSSSSSSFPSFLHFPPILSRLLAARSSGKKEKKRGDCSILTWCGIRQLAVYRSFLFFRLIYIYETCAAGVLFQVSDIFWANPG